MASEDDKTEMECPNCGHEIGEAFKPKPDEPMKYQRACQQCGERLPDKFR